jgi:putative membrane protein
MYTKTNTRSIQPLIKAFGPQLLWYGPYVTAVYFAYSELGYEKLDIKMSIATVLGFTVALLLGFRTTSAYGRWWEARKI